MTKIPFTFAMLSTSAALTFSSAANAAPDVLGVSLGMSPDKVLVLIQQRGVELKRQPNIGTIQLTARNPSTGRTEPLANGKYTSQMRVGEARQETSGSDGEDELSVNFTPTPGTERVAAVYRRVGFQPSGAPLIGNLVADLKKKYGAPTFESNDSNNAPKLLHWSFNNGSTLMTKNAGARCHIQFPAPTGYVSNPTSPEVSWDAPIRTSGFASPEAYFAECGSTILQVRLLYNAQLGTVSRMFVQHLAVSDIVKTQATANALMRGAEDAAKSRAIDGASQVKSPKL